MVVHKDSVFVGGEAELRIKQDPDTLHTVIKFSVSEREPVYKITCDNVTRKAYIPSPKEVICEGEQYYYFYSSYFKRANIKKIVFTANNMIFKIHVDDLEKLAAVKSNNDSIKAEWGVKRKDLLPYVIKKP